MKLTSIFLFSYHLLGFVLLGFLPQGSLIKPNDPDEPDFMSANPQLIWGILIAVFLVATVTYLIYAAKKRKQQEDQE